MGGRSVAGDWFANPASLAARYRILLFPPFPTERAVELISRPWLCWVGDVEQMVV